MYFNNQISNEKIVSSRPNEEKNNSKDFEIICIHNSNLRFEKMSDDFTYHLLECDNCLKNLLLFQARKIKEEKQILNYEKLNNKKVKIKNLNNSMNQYSNNDNIESSKDELEKDSNSEESLISN